jgi:hypothetical protein
LGALNSGSDFDGIAVSNGFYQVLSVLAPLVSAKSRSRVEESGPARPHTNGAAVSDKSPRQHMTKNSGKSLKAKRAEKRAKADRQTSTEATLHFKNH